MKYGFNTNNVVCIKLNKYGLEIIENHYSKLGSKFGIETKNNYQKEMEEYGYVRMQLWEVMTIFGPHIGLGKQMPFDTQIGIDSKYLTNL